MEKLFLFLYRAPWLTREEFGKRYLEEHAPLVLEHCPRLRRYVANVVENDVEGYDVALEFLLDTMADYDDPSRLYASREGQRAVEEHRKEVTGRAIAYHVIEKVQLDHEQTWPDGARSPGQKLLAPITRVDGLTHDRFAEHWTTTHSSLAVKHLRGMGRYVTNIVDRALTDGTPEIDGIVEVHYTGERSFDSPEGQQALVADTESLLQTPARSMAGEYILRS